MSTIRIVKEGNQPTKFYSTINNVEQEFKNLDEAKHTVENNAGKKLNWQPIINLLQSKI